MLTWTFLIVASAKSDANDPEQAKQGTQGLMFLVTMLGIGAYAGLHFAGASAAARTACCLIGYVAAMQSLVTFYDKEINGEGLGWAQLAEGTESGPSLLGCWGFFLLDGLLYMWLATSRSRPLSAETSTAPRSDGVEGRDAAHAPSCP